MSEAAPKCYRRGREAPACPAATGKSEALAERGAHLLPLALGVAILVELDAACACPGRGRD